MITNSSDVQGFAYVNENDQTLRLTSNGIEAFKANKTIVSVRFNLDGVNNLNVADFSSTEAYLNSELVNLEVRGKKVVTDATTEVSVFPNPTTGRIFVNPTADVNVQLFDINGQFVTSVMNLTANQNNLINVEGLNNGVYLMKIYNDSFATTKKVFVAK